MSVSDSEVHDAGEGEEGPKLTTTGRIMSSEC